MMEKKYVEGKEDKDIMLYALSTCGWCRKTKNLLQDMGVAYHFIDVDLLEKDTRDEALEEMNKFNPRKSFPTLVVDGSRCIVGFDENKIRQELG